MILKQKADSSLIMVLGTNETSPDYYVIMGVEARHGLVPIFRADYFEHGEDCIWRLKENVWDDEHRKVASDLFERWKGVVQSDLIYPFIPYSNLAREIRALQPIFKDMEADAICFEVNDENPEAYHVDDRVTETAWYEYLFLSRLLPRHSEDVKKNVLLECFALGYKLIARVGFRTAKGKRRELRSLFYFDRDALDNSVEMFAIQGFMTLLEYDETASSVDEWNNKLARNYIGWFTEKKNCSCSCEFDLKKIIISENFGVNLLKGLLQEEPGSEDDISFDFLFSLLFTSQKEFAELWKEKDALSFKRHLSTKILFEIGCKIYECEQGDYSLSKEVSYHLEEDNLKRFCEEWFTEESLDRLHFLNRMIVLNYSLGRWKEAAFLFKYKSQAKCEGICFSTEEHASIIQYVTNRRLGRDMDNPEKDDKANEDMRGALYNILDTIYPKDMKMVRLYKLFKEAQLDERISSNIFLDLVCVYETAQFIRRKLIVPITSPILDEAAYCTSFDAFQYVLCDSEHKLKIMDCCYMNDPKEGKVLTGYLGIEHSLEQYSNMFLKSFSIGGETLPLWNTYGDKHKGVYVVVDRSFFQQLFDKKIVPYRMVYVSEDRETVKVVAGNKEDKIYHDLSDEIKYLMENLKVYIDDAMENLEQLIKRKQLPKQMDQVALCKAIEDVIDENMRVIRYLFKYEHSEYEKEIRLLYEENDGSKVELLPQKDSVPLLAVSLPVPLYVKKLVLGACFEKPLKVIPYVNHVLEQMRPAGSEESCRNRTRFSKFYERVCE